MFERLAAINGLPILGAMAFGLVCLGVIMYLGINSAKTLDKRHRAPMK